MEEEKRMKVKKGWLAVRVEDRRFVIPISNLYHPLFKDLLESAHDVYGYQSSGPLQLPCSVEDFLHLRWLIEREPKRVSFTNQHQHQRVSSSLRAC